VAVDAVSPSKGDNVVIADMDFPLFYVEAKRLSSRGVEVRVAQNADGDYELDPVLRADRQEDQGCHGELSDVGQRAEARRGRAGQGGP
jgi:hypothetical protein